VLQPPIAHTQCLLSLLLVFLPSLFQGSFNCRSLPSLAPNHTIAGRLKESKLPTPSQPPLPLPKNEFVLTVLRWFAPGRRLAINGCAKSITSSRFSLTPRKTLLTTPRPTSLVRANINPSPWVHPYALTRLPSVLKMESTPSTTPTPVLRSPKKERPLLAGPGTRICYFAIQCPTNFCRRKLQKSISTEGQVFRVNSARYVYSVFWLDRWV
jgi:hypothetical protein